MSITVYITMRTILLIRRHRRRGTFSSDNLLYQELNWPTKLLCSRLYDENKSWWGSTRCVINKREAIPRLSTVFKLVFDSAKYFTNCKLAPAYSAQQSTSAIVIFQRLLLSFCRDLENIETFEDERLLSECTARWMHLLNYVFKWI